MGSYQLLQHRRQATTSTNSINDGSHKTVTTIDNAAQYQQQTITLSIIINIIRYLLHRNDLKIILIPEMRLRENRMLTI